MVSVDRISSGTLFSRMYTSGRPKRGLRRGGRHSLACIGRSSLLFLSHPQPPRLRSWSELLLQKLFFILFPKFCEFPKKKPGRIVESTSWLRRKIRDQRGYLTFPDFCLQVLEIPLTDFLVSKKERDTTLWFFNILYSNFQLAQLQKSLFCIQKGVVFSCETFFFFFLVREYFYNIICNNLM